MAASGSQTIQLYYSTTSGASPVAGNLASGEIAININDGKLYYKDSSGNVQLLASKAAASGSFSDITASGNVTLSAGAANGVAYLNGSKVLTTGSALTFDGTNLGVGSTATDTNSYGRAVDAIGTNGAAYYARNAGGNTIGFFGAYYGAFNTVNFGSTTNSDLVFYRQNAEGMRLTSTGLSTQKDATIQGVTVGRGAGAVSTNTAVGVSALASGSLSGGLNTAVGYVSLNGNTTGANNSGFGYGTLASNTTGSSNLAVGTYALNSNTTASNNTAVGYQASYGNITGTENVAVGYQASYTTTNAYYTTAVGFKAAYSLGAAWHNTAVGHTALYSTTTGEYNTAVGRQALYSNITSAYNTAVGYQSLYANTGERNTSVGYAALSANTTGIHNAALGMQTLVSNTTGSYNTAYGSNALASNTTASYFTAVGYQAAYANTTGTGIAIGAQASYKNTTGADNVAIGNAAFYENTTGSNNTALGRSALANNSTASNNTAVGYQAGTSNTTGSENSFFGMTTAQYNTTGYNNSAFGVQSLRYNTTGIELSAFGRNALYSNTTGNYNTAFGSNALQNNTTASNNTAVGYQAGYSNQTGIGNLFAGKGAGYTATGDYSTYVGFASGPSVSSTGTYNTAVGAYAGNSLTSGSYNTFIGGLNSTGSYGAGSAITSGSKNTIIGNYSGNNGGLDIRTASNYIVLSDGDGNPRMRCNGSGGWLVTADYSGNEVFNVYNSNASAPYGQSIIFTGGAPNNSTNYFLYCADNAAQRVTLRSNGGIANYQANDSNLSDRREKTNFAPAGEYLSKICAIPVQTFNYIDQNLDEDPGLTLGVVAQDVQAVAPELVTESNWGTEDEPKMRLSIYQTDLQYALMKSVQELAAQVETLKAELAALKGA